MDFKRKSKVSDAYDMFTFRMEKKLHERIFQLAHKEHCTQSEIIHQFLKAGLAQYEKEKGHDE